MQLFYSFGCLVELPIPNGYLSDLFYISSMKKLILLLLIVPTIGLSQSKRELKVVNKAKQEITKSIHKYTGITHIESPSKGKGIFSANKLISFSRKIDNDGIYQFLRVNEYSLAFLGEGSGLIVYFEDGTRFERKSSKVDYYDTGGEGWNYSVSTLISNKELEIFANKKIVGFDMDIFERKIPKNEALKVMGYARGILDSK